jgi:hypothetical protein
MNAPQFSTDNQGKLGKKRQLPSRQGMTSLHLAKFWQVQQTAGGATALQSSDGPFLRIRKSGALRPGWRIL